MIDKKLIESHLDEILKNTGIFLVDVKIDNNNKIQVYIDRKEGLKIDDCVNLSRSLEGMLDRDVEDFALEVSSPGLDSPLKVPKQYEKNYGKMVSVTLKDGEKVLGVLLKAEGDLISLEIPSEKKAAEAVKKELDMNDIKSVRLHIQF